MDGNVDAEVCFPCPRCGVYVKHNDSRHARKCRAVSNLNSSTVHLGKQELSFEELCEPCDVSKRRIHEQREMLMMSSASLTEGSFVKDSVKALTKSMYNGYNGAASDIVALDIATKYNRPQDVAWLTPLVSNILAPHTGWETKRTETRLVDALISPVAVPPPRTMGVDEEGRPMLVYNIPIQGQTMQVLSNPVLLYDVKRDRPPYAGVISDSSHTWAWRQHLYTKMKTKNVLFYSHAADSTNLLCPIGPSHNVLKVGVAAILTVLPWGADCCYSETLTAAIMKY